MLSKPGQHPIIGRYKENLLIETYGAYIIQGLGHSVSHPSVTLSETEGFVFKRFDSMSLNATRPRFVVPWARACWLSVAFFLLLFSKEYWVVRSASILSPVFIYSFLTLATDFNYVYMLRWQTVITQLEWNIIHNASSLSHEIFEKFLMYRQVELLIHEGYK